MKDRIQIVGEVSKKPIIGTLGDRQYGILVLSTGIGFPIPRVERQWYTAIGWNDAATFIKNEIKKGDLLLVLTRPHTCEGKIGRERYFFTELRIREILKLKGEFKIFCPDEDWDVALKTNRI